MDRDDRRPRPDDPTGDPTTSPTPTDPTDPTTGPIGPSRRWDCSGLDPADAAPLGGKVALTFDDGPHPVHTAAIVDTLRARDVPATFFVVGEMLSDTNSWDLVEEMVADPLFDIANHSWSHADLSALSRSALEAEIDDTTGLIETFGVGPTFFRFPYGASDCAAADMVRARGMHMAGWHIDTADWCYAALGTRGVCTTADYWRIPSEYTADMLGFTMEQLRRFDGGVVLMHDIHGYTADTLNELLDNLDAGGFEVVPLADVDAFPGLNADLPADLPYLGEACDPVDDACWQIEYQSWCEPTAPGADSGICTIGCEGYCLDRPGAATTFCASVDPGAGQCVGRADSENAWCDDLPDTVATTVDRFVGDSGAASLTAEVCAPSTW